MAELMDVIKGISQVMAQTYDGATDEKGQPIKAGLRREDGVEFHKYNGTECRLLDGFRARVSHRADRNNSFPCVIISYQSELKLEEAHSPGFASDIEQHIAEAVKYLKKEFKKVTGKELSVEKYGDMKLLVEELSKIRTQVTAQCCYKINNVDMPKLESEKDVERSQQLQKWLALGGLKK
jgi:hypothetical protein